jgi:hypothetical protein
MITCCNSFLSALCDWFQWIRMKWHGWQVSFLRTLLPLHESLLALSCWFWVKAVAFVLHNWSVEVLFCAIVLHLIIISVWNSITATLVWSLVIGQVHQTTETVISRFFNNKNSSSNSFIFNWLSSNVRWEWPGTHPCNMRFFFNHFVYSMLWKVIVFFNNKLLCYVCFLGLFRIFIVSIL